MRSKLLSNTRLMVVVAIAVSALCGCSDNRSVAAAELALVEHFDDIRLGNTNALIARYSPEFFLMPKHSREELYASMVELHESGAIDYNVIRRDIRHDKKGMIVSLFCQSRYGAKTYQENFEFFCAVGTTNFIIVRHEFD